MTHPKHFTSDTPPSNSADRAEQAGFVTGMALLSMMQTANLELTACIELLALALLDEHQGPHDGAPDYQHARGLAAALYPVLCRGLAARPGRREGTAPPAGRAGL